MKLLPLLEADGKLGHYRGFLIRIVEVVVVQVFVRYFELLGHYLVRFL